MAARAADRPRVRVAAVIETPGGIVLVRHRAGARRYHLLPGGGVEPGESLASALQREVEEETGLQVEVERPLFLSDTLAPDGSRHIVHIVFLARQVGGAIGTPQDHRVEGVDVVAPEGLGDLDLRPPIAGQLLEAAKTGFAGPASYLGPLWVDEPLT